MGTAVFGGRQDLRQPERWRSSLITLRHWEFCVVNAQHAFVVRSQDIGMSLLRGSTDLGACERHPEDMPVEASVEERDRRESGAVAIDFHTLRRGRHGYSILPKYLGVMSRSSESPGVFRTVLPRVVLEDMHPIQNRRGKHWLLR
ncbi:MAG: hypothetical protein ACI9JD_002593 [Rhodococcus sp. (in: high G+C Gram-positive bacteria)]